MEISDISKVANRKRMNTDVEKLREKVSRETAKIIKLKVAQDTAYWDLKEKLQQVEGNHERLQQNMVEVQMQHESLSSRHQEELRRRPETLNKVAGTRSICAVLEEYGGRVKASVARGRRDAAALSDAYAAGARRVRDLASRLAALAAAHHAARDHLAHLRHLLLQKEEAVAELRAEARSAAQDHDARLARAADLLADRDTQISSLRAAAGEAAERADTLRQRLQEAEASAAEAARRVAELEDRERALTRALHDGRQALTGAQAASGEAGERLAAAEALNVRLQSEVKALENDAARATAAAGDLAAAKRSLEDRLDTVQNDFDKYRGESEATVAELRAGAAAAEREVTAASATIARLMADVRDEVDRRAKLDAALAAQRRHADALARDKDDELAKQMSIILECRAEKERLQERIAAMQATIDNIQKELTGRAPLDPHHRPERDPEPEPAPDAPHPPPPRAPLLYDFLSDSSVDGETLDANEVRRRFEALSRAPRPPSASATAAPRPAPPPRFSHATISLSQVKNDLKMKERTFFKNKRFAESKAKKPK